MSSIDIHVHEDAVFNISIPPRVAALRHWLPWGYLVLAAAAEAVVAFVSPQLGLILHALLLLGLMLHGGLGRRVAGRRFALALTVAPLFRILSLSLPLANISHPAWYPFVSVPLLLATGILIWQLRIPRTELGLRGGNLVLQFKVMGAGLGLGTLEYIILAPDPLITRFSWGTA
jgi:hypothetical protein